MALTWLKQKRWYIFFLLLALLIVSIYYLNSSRSAEDVRPEIEAYFNNNYEDRFHVLKVEQNYSKDLFHQSSGYKVWLIDNNGISFGEIFMEFNQAQKKWIPFMGSDIEAKYQEAKNKRLPNTR